MTSEFSTIPMNELGNYMVGQAFPSSEFSKEEGVRLLRGDNVKTGFIQWGEKEFLWPKGSDGLEKYLLESGDIVIGMDGSRLGRNWSLVREEDLPALLVQRVARIRPHNEVCRELICSAIDSHYFHWYIYSVSTGSAIPHVSHSDLANFPVPYPHENIRERLSSISYSTRKSIRVNQNISEISHEYASALFQSWFIDFDPVKAKAEGKLPYGMDEETAALFSDSFEESELGPIPAGWMVKSLLEVSNLYDNLRVPLSSMEREERKGDYPYHGATSVMDYVDDFIYDGVHLLIAEDGSVVNEGGYPVLQYVWGKFWVNNHAHVLQGKDDVTTEHLHQYVKHFYIQPFVTGAVQLKINQKALSNVKLVIAPKNINNAFNKIIQSLYRSIRANKMEAENLKLTRDTLLPRLMSGQLKVPTEA